MNPRQAIVLGSGSLQVTNTIVSNYAVGISVSTGSAFEDFNLTGGSPAIDHGTNAGVYVDYDGDPRPLGARFDIGFDERLAVALNNKLYLPLVRK